MCSTEADSTQIDLLLRSRDYNELDGSLWNDKCDYIELEKCSNLNLNNYNLIVMQLNVRSLLAHQQELCQLLRMTERKNLQIDILLLCETFLSKKTLSMVRILGYTNVGNYRKNKKGGGVSILIRNGISHQRRLDLGVFEGGLTESVFVEIRSKNGRHIILGSMYKPPKFDITQFSTNLSHIVNNTRRTQGKHPPELILGMDHNMNLLNGASHPPTPLDLSNLNLLPTITRPT